MKNPQTEKTATACQKTPRDKSPERELREEQWRMYPNTAPQAQHSPTFDEACSHPAVRDVLSERDRLKIHAGALAEALAETRHALYNETAGKQDSHWIKTVKANAAAALAAWEEAK